MGIPWYPRIAGGATCLGLLLGTIGPALAQPGAPAPITELLTPEPPNPRRCVEGFRIQRRYELVAAGASLFGGGYLFGATAGSLGGQLDFLIPVAGPFIAAAKLSPDKDRVNAGWQYLAVLDGLVQAGGLALFIAGFTTTKRVLVYGKTGVSLAPYAGPGSGGLMALGRF